jgi:hypothetical protein
VRKLDVAVEPVGCGEGCPKRYCSVECRDRAMELYHAPLCQYHATLNDLENLAALYKTGGSRVSMLAWKMLGMALQRRKPGQEYLSAAPADMYPYCHLARKTDAPAGCEREFDLVINAVFYLRIWQTIHSTTGFSGDPLLGMKWLIDCNTLFMANGVSLCPPGGNDDVMKRGQAIMLPGTMFNHSCAANASYDSPVNNKVEFFATETIEAGEEITIPYCHSDTPVRDRRMVLQRTYGFLCDCKKCKVEMATL